MVPKDRSRDPFTCYSKETIVKFKDAMNDNEATHGWCGTCDPSAAEKGRVPRSAADDPSVSQAVFTITEKAPTILGSSPS